MKRILITLLTFSLTFILTGCFKQTTTVETVDTSKTTQTEDTTPETHSWSGILKPVSNSLIADGTHVLLSKDSEFIAELFSRTIDLTAYEGQEVNLTGIPTEKNARMLVEVTKISGTSTDPVADLWKVLPILVVEHDPDMAWEDAVYTLLDSSDTAGTATVIAQIDDEYFTIKLVRKDDALTGEWSIYSVYDTTDSELAQLTALSEEETTDEEEVDATDEETPADEETDTEDEENTDEEDTETDVTITAPTTIDPQVSESSVNETTLQSIIGALPNFLSSEYELTGNPALTKLEFSSPNFVYVTYANESTPGMVLLTYNQTDNGMSFSEKATFTPGETADWQIESGVNSAKNLAKDIFVSDGSSWNFKGNVDKGYDLFNWSTGVQFEVPYSWYYWQRGSSIAFSNQPVEDDNIGTEIYYSTGDVSSALATFEGTVTSEGAVTLGEYSGKKQTLEDGKIRYAVDYGDFSLIIEALPENQANVEHILSSVSE